MPYEFSEHRVWVAGHRGMVGAAIVRRLRKEACGVLTVGREQLDLRCQADVERWIAEEKPEAIFLAAGKVGGIQANMTFPVDFLYDNLMMELNIVRAAYETGVRKLLFLGSSCIYPRDAPQPITEDALLEGALEPTNQWYAIAKIAGIRLCQAFRQQYGCDFISAMPTNLFGPGDNFHPENSHVPAALLSRFHDAKTTGTPEVVVWGTGTPLREFLYVDDLADACVTLMKTYSDTPHINVGTGKEVTIRAFAEMIAKTVGFQGRLVFDDSKPDGMPRKLLDVTRLTELGWTAPTALEDGLKQYYAWYLENESALRTS